MSLFKNNTIATINYIECPHEIDSESAKDFEAMVKSWRELPSKIHALDFRRVRKVSPSFYHQIMSFHKELKDRGLRLVSINLAASMEQQFSRDGVLGDFGFIRDFKTLVPSRPAHKIGEDEVRQTLAKYLVDAARRAMETLFEVTVAADENFLENLREFKVDKFYRAATMNVHAELFRAQFRLYFPRETLMSLTRKMVGDAATDEETSNSTATELLNMIYGGAKSYLNDEKAFNLPPAIPTLVLKDDIAKLVRLQDPRNSICMPFASPLGTYYLEVDFS